MQQKLLPLRHSLNSVVVVVVFGRKPLCPKTLHFINNVHLNIQCYIKMLNNNQG